MALIDTIKNIVNETGNANVPTAFLFGTVTAVNPLTVFVDNRFYISEPSLVIMKEFRIGEYKTHVHSILPHSHAVVEHNTEVSEGHEHIISILETEETPLVTALETYSGLKVGEKIVVLRNQGGQSFLVLGRV